MSRICAFLFSLILMCGCGFGAWAQARVERASDGGSSARITKVAKHHKRYKQGKHPSGRKKGHRKGQHPQGHQS
jgi:hypothetical protein